MDKLNDKNNNADVRGRYTELLETIAVNLNGKHFGDAFQCLTNGLKDSKADVQYSCVRSLVTLSKKWKDKQLDITFQFLIDGFQNKNGYDCSNEKNRKLYAKSIGYILMKLNKKQLDD
ncbi:hypothetical protein RFI_38192, partial [Reticulomyxa filosa]